MTTIFIYFFFVRGKKSGLFFVCSKYDVGRKNCYASRFVHVVIHLDIIRIDFKLHYTVLILAVYYINNLYTATKMFALWRYMLVDEFTNTNTHLRICGPSQRIRAFPCGYDIVSCAAAPYALHIACFPVYIVGCP